VEDTLPAVGDALGRLASAASKAVRDHRTDATLQLVLAGVAGLLVMTGIALVVSRGIVRPLREVSTVLRGLAGGDLTTRSGVSSTDEVGRLARDVNQTIGSIHGTVSSLSASASTVARSATEFNDVAQRMAASAEQSSSRAARVTGTAAEVSQNVDTLATASEEMGSSIGEISRNANEALRVAGDAVTMAQQTSETMARLGDSSAEIGNVVKVITQIAEQTNLLALNATIEAARAGAMGKGFAVVAGEVKELAQETAKATEDISHRVEAIQADTGLAVEAIDQIGAIIARINDFQVTIASAVEEQTATTQETSRTISDVAGRTNDIAATISGMAGEAARNTEEAGTSLTAARRLTAMSEEMSRQAGQFRF
jgi:methyl-accepting chemotaxis protein